MTSSANSSDGKVIILTGAGGGIGLSILTQLLAQPSVSRVVGVDVVTTQLEQLLETNSGRLSVVQGDIAERVTSERAVQLALAHNGKVDSIILNAATLRPIGRVAESSVDDWKRLFDINFFGLLHSIQVALPHLRQTNGNILMTSSGVSLTPYAAWTAYACSKAAMNWLGACLTKEEDRVTCLCVEPGIVDSGLQKQVRDEHQANMPTEQYTWLLDLHAQGKLLRPDQPAASFVHLAVNGIPSHLNGRVVAWDDAELRAGPRGA